MVVMSQLFTPITLGSTTFTNRAWVSPMCMYSVEAHDGIPTDFHRVHYGSFALGGWGLVLTEAAAVVPEGRISPHDVGIWSDEQVAAWRTITDFAHAHGTPMGVQLAHAGRKASWGRGFPGEPTGTVDEADGGWTPVGPTDALGDSKSFRGTVTALDAAGIQAVVDAFAAGARRAKQAGFDVVEVHGAHGYLLHQFVSPLSNTRTDQWGGSFDNRVRIVLDVVRAVRSAFDGPVLLRVSATDWREDGWDVEQTVRLASLVKELGVDLVDVSSGGNVRARFPVGPGYQTHLAAQVRREAQLPTSAVGMISTPEQAEHVVVSGQADVVLLAREALRNPHWPLAAARQLGVAVDELRCPPQYLRALP